LSPDTAAARFGLTLLTRADCGLCEEMLRELAALRLRHPLPPLTLLDVDSERELQRRWGLKIPVLLLDEILVCNARLDEQALLRALRDRHDAA
jgi:Glutaredoxin-like domain (DUF836)